MYERNKDIYSRNGVKRVVIIGSGNVAEALAKAIGASRYELVQIYARNRERGQAIARAVRCACADDPKRIAEADIYLMAVSDRAVPKLSESFDFGDAVVAHTAGSVALGELAPRIRNKGVFYPLQTFTAGRSLELSDVPLFIEGNNDFTVDQIFHGKQSPFRNRTGAGTYQNPGEFFKTSPICSDEAFLPLYHNMTFPNTEQTAGL